MNMLMLGYARTVEGEDGIMAHGICTRFLPTGLMRSSPTVMRKMGAQQPEVGAELVLGVLERKRRGMGRVVF